MLKPLCEHFINFKDEREKEYVRVPVSRSLVVRSRSRSGDRDFRSERYIGLFYFSYPYFTFIKCYKNEINLQIILIFCNASYLNLCFNP